MALTCDEASVRRVDLGPHLALRIGTDLTVLVSPAEQTSLASRQRVLTAMRSPLFTAHAESLGGYAGSYFDQSSGGIVTVLYVADPRRRWSELAGRFPFPDLLTVRRATWTFAQLSDLQRRIAADMPTLAGRALEVASLDIDVARNAVVVRVASDASHASTILIARYGPAVRAERGNADELLMPVPV
jgi:hypothetical protein